eukprot:5716205-Prymnesium_polylepis.1
MALKPLKPKKIGACGGPTGGFAPRPPGLNAPPLPAPDPEPSLCVNAQHKLSVNSVVRRRS